MTASPAGDDVVEVRLLGVPLDGYRAASEHGDELRREFSLMAAGDGATSVPGRLLALIEALEERFSTFSEAPREVLAQALDRGDDRIDVVYRVPPAVREAALELDALLDEADEFCRRGDHLLTLATPPEALAVRRWFLSQFIVQIEGAPPTTWEDWAAHQAPADER